jgi:hypothetical protein
MLGFQLVCTYAPGSKVDNKKKPKATGIVSPGRGGCSGGPWIINASICTNSTCAASPTNAANGMLLSRTYTMAQRAMGLC